MPHAIEAKCNLMQMNGEKINREVLKIRVGKKMLQVSMLYKVCTVQISASTEIARIVCMPEAELGITIAALHCPTKN